MLIASREMLLRLGGPEHSSSINQSPFNCVPVSQHSSRDWGVRSLLAERSFTALCVLIWLPIRLKPQRGEAVAGATVPGPVTRKKPYGTSVFLAPTGSFWKNSNRVLISAQTTEFWLPLVKLPAHVVYSECLYVKNYYVCGCIFQVVSKGY